MTRDEILQYTEETLKEHEYHKLYGDDAPVIQGLLMQYMDSVVDNVGDKLRKAEQTYLAAYRLAMHYKDYDTLVRAIYKDKVSSKVGKVYKVGELEVRLEGNVISSFNSGGIEYGVAVFVTIGELANILDLC